MQDGARRVPGKEPVLPCRASRANDLSLELLERPETPALSSQILPGFGRLQLQGFPGNDAGGSTSPDSGTHMYASSATTTAAVTAQFGILEALQASLLLGGGIIYRKPVSHKGRFSSPRLST